MFLHRDKNLLLYSKKLKKIMKTKIYIYSEQIDKINLESENYIGRIKSNFLGDEYLVYDNGKATLVLIYLMLRIM